MLQVFRIAAVIMLLGSLVLGGCDGNGNGDNPPPPPTENNTFQTAWTVRLPYAKQVTVPMTDSAEFFYFGIGETQVFAQVIVINVELIEPTGKDFNLGVQLFNQDQDLLVESSDSDVEPAAWIASRPEQTYYLGLAPVGDPETDRYTYRINITTSAVNDPFEPDNDFSQAQSLILGVESTGAYLVDAYSDTLESMYWLPDFYSFQIQDTTLLYAHLYGLGEDCNPVMRLYNPDAELFAQAADTSGVFDLTGSGFKQGRWYLEINLEESSYPSYDKGQVRLNYLDVYTIWVSTQPK